MLTIRKRQMEVLEAHMREQFRLELLRRLRRELRDETRDRPDEELLALIDDGIGRARRYGITIERDVSLYVCLMVVYGPRFEEGDDMLWARKILLKPHMNGEGKLRLICQMLSARQQEQTHSRR